MNNLIEKITHKPYLIKDYEGKPMGLTWVHPMKWYIDDGQIFAQIANGLVETMPDRERRERLGRYACDLLSYTYEDYCPLNLYGMYSPEKTAELLKVHDARLKEDAKKKCPDYIETYAFHEDLDFDYENNKYHHGDWHSETPKKIVYSPLAKYKDTPKPSSEFNSKLEAILNKLGDEKRECYTQKLVILKQGMAVVDSAWYLVINKVRNWGCIGIETLEELLGNMNAFLRQYMGEIYEMFVLSMLDETNKDLDEFRKKIDYWTSKTMAAEEKAERTEKELETLKTTTIRIETKAEAMRDKLSVVLKEMVDEKILFPKEEGDKLVFLYANNDIKLKTVCRRIKKSDVGLYTGIYNDLIMLLRKPDGSRLSSLESVKQTVSKVRSED